MLRAINYCGLRVEYDFVKKNIKNINIRITPEGSISVSAPFRVPAETVDGFVEEKAEWIFRKMADIEKRREAMPDDVLRDGKEAFFLGRKYTIRLEKGNKFGVELGEGKITVSARNGDENLKAKYIKWLEKEAEPVFEQSLSDMMRLMDGYGIERPGLYIRNMKSRWGSCNNRQKRVGLNVQLIKADRDCIEQVVLHELAHFVHYDHGEGFYALLGKLMPDWKERKKRLETSYNDGII